MNIVIYTNGMSNYQFIEIDGHTVQEIVNWTLPNYSLENVHPYQSIDTVFIINIHCLFGNYTYMQDQAGVHLYRQLLKNYDCKQDRLKVIFFSHYTKKQLVYLKPENYVIKHLPFIECRYDGKFSTQIKDVITQYENTGWPQFNTTSENLLSGWAINNKDAIKNNTSLNKIHTADKSILFIDDQQSEWQIAFDEIFEKESIEYCRNKGMEISSQNEYRACISRSWDQYKIQLKEVVQKKKPDLILSDFYLKENHEITQWKDTKSIENISGFQVFDALRFEFPATPYVFHTSSNKANIYKYFDTRGVDDWIVKDIVPNSANKAEYYQVFKDCIEEFLHSGVYNNLKDIWEKIERIEKESNFWWSTDFDSEKDSIVYILKDAWFALRRSVNKEEVFETSLQSEFGTNQTITACAIINSLGKIGDLLELKGTTKYKQVSGLHFIIVKFRDAASHSQNKDLYTISLEDAIFVFQLTLILLLETDPAALENSFPYPNKNNFFITSLKVAPGDFEDLRSKGDAKQKALLLIQFKYAIFWTYCQLYNTRTYRKGLVPYENFIRNRIESIYKRIGKESVFLQILHDYFLKDNSSIYKDKDLKCTVYDVSEIGLAFDHNNSRELRIKAL